MASSGSTLKMGWPNRITIGRILLIAPFVACLLNQTDPGYSKLRWVALGLLGMMAISDFLDGYLARRFQDFSPLGKFLDPLADKLLITIAVVILCVVGVRDDGPPGTAQTLRLPNWVAIAAIGKDLLVSIGFGVVYLSTGTIFIEPRWIGKTCTTVQLLMVLAVLSWCDLPAALAFLPRALWTTSAILAAVAAVDYIRFGHRYVAKLATDENAQGRMK